MCVTTRVAFCRRDSSKRLAIFGALRPRCERDTDAGRAGHASPDSRHSCKDRFLLVGNPIGKLGLKRRISYSVRVRETSAERSGGPARCVLTVCTHRYRRLERYVRSRAHTRTTIRVSRVQKEQRNSDRRRPPLKKNLRFYHPSSDENSS